MARNELTPRQKEISDLIKQGQKAPQIAKKLKISENAVYQNIRRMRAAGNAPKTTKASGSGSKSAKRSTAKASSTRRQSGRTVRTARPAPAPVKVTVTAEELLQSEIGAVEQQVAEQAAIVAEAKAAIEAAEAATVELNAERERKADVLAVLTGEKVAHAKPAPPKPKAPRKAPAKAQEAAKPPEGGSAPSEAPAAPQEPQETTQAQREATAEHDGGLPDERAEAEAAQQAAEEPVPA